MDALIGKTNDELIYLIRYTNKKDEAATQLLKQKPTNDQLIKVIWHTTKKDEAATQLLKQNPTNDDLIEVIWYTEKKDEAATQLLQQNPTNHQLIEVIRDTNKKDEAATQLLQQLGYDKSQIDEEALIRQIADIVVKEPENLNMKDWHCNTTHCLAGWATTIDPVAREIEIKCKEAGFKNETEMAGCAVLPNYAHLFYSDNEEVMKILKEISDSQTDHI